MSWYLFNNSPQRQYRGKKVEGYQNQQKTKVIMDWGLGQLSPQKNQSHTQTIQQPPRATKSNYEKTSHTKPRNIQKQKVIQQAVKILTESSDDQGKEQLIRALKKYDTKPQKASKHSRRQSTGLLPVMSTANNRSDKSQNVLNSFQFASVKQKDHSKDYLNVDLDTAKRMRFLESNLLPENKRDNMSAILDFGLNERVANQMTDSRISGKSHFGNKKNQSAVNLGDGFNAFVPMRQKVKDMNQRLREMYDYDEWCRKREQSELKLA